MASWSTTSSEVTLTLSVREYRALRWLVYRHLHGHFPERCALEQAMDEVDWHLGTGPRFCDERSIGEFVENAS